MQIQSAAAFSGDIVFAFKTRFLRALSLCLCVSVSMCCMYFYNPKNSVNALKIVRSTEPQQIDKNTNGRMKMHYYYWVEKYYAFYLSLTSRHESNAQQQHSATPNQTTSNSIHLITRNKSDLLPVKTFYLHIHRESVPAIRFITFNIIPKTYSRYAPKHYSLIRSLSGTQHLYSFLECIRLSD